MKSIFPMAVAWVTLLLLAACSGNESPASTGNIASAALPAKQASVETVGADEGGGGGKRIYGATCAMCHASGLAGAPRPGDKAAWAIRGAQGKDTLYKHAIEGFTGEAGLMPPKGGNASLGDEDVRAAVDYMLAQP